MRMAVCCQWQEFQIRVKLDQCNLVQWRRYENGEHSRSQDAALKARRGSMERGIFCDCEGWQATSESHGVNRSRGRGSTSARFHVGADFGARRLRSHGKWGH